jgi:hypothetical protein
MNKMTRNFSRAVQLFVFLSLGFVMADPQSLKAGASTMSLRAQMKYANSTNFDSTPIFQNFGVGTMGVY